MGVSEEMVKEEVAKQVECRFPKQIRSARSLFMRRCGSPWAGCGATGAIRAKMIVERMNNRGS